MSGFLEIGMWIMGMSGLWKGHVENGYVRFFWKGHVRVFGRVMF